MRELAASNTCGQAVVADTDGLVPEGISEVVFAFGHGSNKDTNTLVGLEGIDIVSDSDDLGVETQGHLPAVGREMVCDGVFDDLEKLLL